MTSYGEYQDAVLNKINDLANPETNNMVMSATTDITDATVPPTPLLCDALGHLQVDVLTGGGEVLKANDGDDGSGTDRTVKCDTKGNLEVLSIPDRNGYAQVLLGTAGATAILGDSTITPTTDPEGRDGWNFINSVAGTKFNLYYFNGAQEVITLGDIDSLFSKLYINNFAGLSGAPFFHIYTKPTGVGDAGAFYHSRIDYEINSDVLVGIGEQVILYAINKPHITCNNRLIELKTKTTNGDGADSEEILYITLSSNSGATINDKNITVSSMGFNTIDLGVDKGVVNRDFKLIAGSNGGATETTLSALNGKITQGSDATLTDAQQVLIYGRNGTGNLKPIHITNNGDVEVEIADFVKGQTTSANSFPVVLSSDQSTINVKLDDISAGIINPINVASKHNNAYLQVLTNVAIPFGGSTTSSSHTLSAGTGMNSTTIYIHTGAGTTDTNFSFFVEKSYDGTHYFADSNFTFSPLGADVNAVNQPAVLASSSTDARFIRVKVNNINQATTTSVNCYIIERQ
jgi:hypothetical protein